MEPAAGRDRVVLGEDRVHEGNEPDSDAVRLVADAHGCKEGLCAPCGRDDEVIPSVWVGLAMPKLCEAVGLGDGDEDDDDEQLRDDVRVP
jgi:hypothetical protein